MDRRHFLKTSAAALAAFSTPHFTHAAEPKRWRKAFMLGQSKGPILPTFQTLKEAGFEGVELVSPNQLDRDEVLKARDETGLVIHGVSGSVHWRKPLSDPNPAAVEEGLTAIRQEILDCKAYGGTTVLVVPAVVNPQVSHRDAEERSRKAIRTLLPMAEEHKIALAIEEVWNKFLLTAPEFARYVDSFESPWVKAYFDVGNVVEYGYPQEWIHELGSRIAKIHIKEYAKEKRFSYALGEGEIDWKAVRQALVDIGYEGWITAEVGMRDLDGLRDVVKRMDDLLPSP
ncbi:MAG TPA: TIM barrel protein [Isosphaeraceae bacterium]|nr:TIM barrel protein [Isosphaeraceae bacterium]